MPDTNANAGTPLRWENAGVLRVYDVAGSTTYTVLMIVPGSLKFKPGRTEGIAQMDRGRRSAVVLAGDERPSEISFKVKPTKTGLSTATTELMALLNPADSAGLKQLYKVEVEIPTNRGASTGVRAVFTSCWMPDPEEYQTGGSGQSQDEVSIKLQSEDSDPSYTSY